MLRTLFYILTYLSIIPLIAQAEQCKRLEIELQSYSGNYQVAPAKNNGVILFTKTNQQDRENHTWVFNFYDTTFRQKWCKNILVNKKLHYDSCCVDGQFLYLLFTNYRTDGFFVLKIDVVNGNANEIKGNYLKDYSIHSFFIRDDQMYIKGSYRENALLGYIDLKTSRFKLLAHSLEGPTNIQSISFEKETGLAKVVFQSWVNKASHLSIISLKNGEKKNSINIKSDAEKNIISARLNILASGERIIIGTYSEKERVSNGITVTFGPVPEKGHVSNGMYICKFAGNNQQFIKFYNFNELQNFFDFLPANQKGNLKEKTERKENNINYNLLVHDIIEKENEYVLVAEAYYPTYQTQYYTAMVLGPNGTMTPVTQIRKVFNGWLYSHVLVGGFSKDGRLLWDKTFEMGRDKSFILKEKINVHYEDKKIILTQAFGTQIQTKVIDGNRLAFQRTEIIPSDINNPEEMRASLPKIEHWYDQYFIAYGYQRIGNEEKEISGKHIFYFNKIVVNNLPNPQPE